MSEAATRLAAALADRYRIERELGHGGMATVYLADDLRHKRKVAIKLLRPELAAVIGAERFLAEITTTANLQHPHILPLHDSGEVDGMVFYVMPFVEGESLRDRLNRERQLPIAEAVRITTEVAGALDYAHRHGVIHRDIKPENILLHDGRALVADFGIALAATSAGTRMTETGMSLGTPHYMSPEQAMGERHLDARTDVYALGCVLYEMLTGEPPFTGPSAQAIVAKVMTEKPTPPSATRDTVPEAVEDAVLTALAKLPVDRFATAAAFATALVAESQAGRRPRGAAGVRGRPSPSRVLIGVAALALLTSGAAAGRWLFGHGSGNGPRFRQRTFQIQAIYNARYAPDGQTIVFSATSSATSGPTDPGIFVIRPDYLEQTSLGFPDAQLLAVSSKGEIALLLHAVFVHHRLFTGTLARVALGGGAPREILAGVREADWSADGSELAIIHDVAGRDRLEYPIGTVVYEASGYLSDPRVSPDGRRIAFAEHPFRWDDRGTVKIVDRTGKVSAVTPEYSTVEGLAWLQSGTEVAFSASRDNLLLAAFAVSTGGRVRDLLSGPGNLTTQDVSASGQLLLTRDDQPYRVMLKTRADTNERDASWLDVSFGSHVSPDGSFLAFTDGGPDARHFYDVMLRRTDGGQAARLGEGAAGGFSPDGKWVAGLIFSSPPRLVLYPTGPGAERRVDIGTFESIGWADWFPDGNSILLCGNHAAEASRCYRQPVAGGAGQSVTPPGTIRGLVSPDGREVLAFAPALGHRRYPVTGGEGAAIPGLAPDENVYRWSVDGRAVLAARPNSQTVERVDVRTGRRQPYLTFGGGHAVSGGDYWLSLADDPGVYAYVATPLRSELFTVDGAR
jgi:eukaryotic-like serine/threonine-protein kinase